MRISQKGESLVGIIIGVTILSFAVIWIMNLIFQSQNVIDNFNENRNIELIEDNALVIWKKIDTSLVLEDEIFYIYKDNINKTYQIYTGTINDGYKYIDENGNHISNTWSYDGQLYERTYILKRKQSPSWSGTYTILSPTINTVN